MLPSPPLCPPPWARVSSVATDMNVQPKNLPLELWSLVASFLQRSDLLSLVLASSIQLGAARPALFRHLIIWPAEITPFLPSEDIPVVRYLRKDGGGLAKRVERLDFDAPVMPNDGVNSISLTHILTLPFDVLALMTNLRVLSMRRYSSFLNANLKSFVDVLQTHCHSLREVVFDELILPPGRDASFELAGVQKVTARDTKGFGPLYNSFSSPTLLSLLTASSTTLTHLILPSEIDDIEAEALISFSRIFFFPRLHTLFLGPWVDVDSPEIATSLAQFLYSHPTIHTLILGYDVTSEWHVDLWWDDFSPLAGFAALFDPTKFLPNLHSLNAHPQTIAYIVKKAPAAFKNLVELKLGTGLDADALYDLTDLLAVLRRTEGVLPNLNKLVYIAGDSMCAKLDEFVEWMEGFARVCSTLERWEGDLPFGVTLIPLLLAFSSFTNLRDVHIRSAWPSEGLHELGNIQTRIDAARALASSCPKLETFSSVTSPQLNTVARRIIVRIERSDEGDIGTSLLMEDEEDDGGDW